MKTNEQKSNVRKLLMTALTATVFGMTLGLISPVAKSCEVTTTTTRTTTTHYPSSGISIFAQFPIFGFGVSDTHYTTVAQNTYHTDTYYKESYDDDGSWKNKENFAKKPSEDSYDGETSGKCSAWDGKGQCLKKVW